MTCPKIASVGMNQFFVYRNITLKHHRSNIIGIQGYPPSQCHLREEIRPFLMDYQPQSSFNNPLIRPYFFGGMWHWEGTLGFHEKHHLCPTFRSDNPLRLDRVFLQAWWLLVRPSLELLPPKTNSTLNGWNL